MPSGGQGGGLGAQQDLPVVSSEKWARGQDWSLWVQRLSDSLSAVPGLTASTSYSQVLWLLE